MKIVVVILYRRFEYSRRVLENLAANVGVDQYTVLIQVDPDFPEVEELARTFPLTRKEVVINARRLGCNGNVRAALTRAFALSSYVVALEDDVVPARDALRFFEWCDRPHYRDDPMCFGACAYHRELPPTDRFNQVIRVPWFTPWGWATWRDRWREMEVQWPGGGAEGRGAGTSWDVIVNRSVRSDRYMLHPRLARVQNVGATDGTYCTDKAFHAEHQYNANWAGAVAAPDGELFWEQGDELRTARPGDAPRLLP